MDEKTIFCGIFVVMWIEYLWETYLTYRQHQVYKKVTTVPPELAENINEETFQKSRAYALDKSYFSMFKGLYSIALSSAMVWFYLQFHFWEYSKQILSTLNLPMNELLISCAFMILTNSVNMVVQMPLSVYTTFVLEEKHGFNKQTVGFFIKDQIKSFLVTTVIMVPLTGMAIYIIQIGGDYFFVYLWGFAMIVLLFLMTIYPDYIAPIFDKYTPLPEGELRTNIEKLAEELQFPLYKLYLVEGSKRSVHSNAYFYGFFKNKRIVLFDTLLKDKSKDDDKGCENDEILAVLSHEFGHWQYNHVAKNILITQVNLFFQFFAFGFLFKYPVLYHAFNFHNEQPIIIGLIIILQFVFSPYHTITSFFMTMLSRKFEFQADFYAKSLGKAEYLKKALIKLHKDNLSFPVYDWLYSAWNHSHPPILERLEVLKKDD